MEAAPLISKSTFTGAKGAEVLSRPGCDVSEELENDAALRGYRVSVKAVIWIVLKRFLQPLTAMSKKTIGRDMVVE
jgi:hypothetical protein